MLNVIVNTDMSWLENVTVIERAFYQVLEQKVKTDTQVVSVYWMKKDIKAFYQEHRDLVQERERELDTYKWFITSLEDAYALAGQLHYPDILGLYRQSIYFGILS